MQTPASFDHVEYLMIYVSVADNEMICQDFVTNFISTKILILYDILGKREDYDVISWGLPQGTSKSVRLSSDFSVYISRGWF